MKGKIVVYKIANIVILFSNGSKNNYILLSMLFLYLVISSTKCIGIVPGGKREVSVSVCLCVCVCVCLSVQSRLAKLLGRFQQNFPKIVSHRPRGVRFSLKQFGQMMTSWRPFCKINETTFLDYMYLCLLMFG